MASFYEVVNRILRPYYTYILITFLLILFLLGAHYAYTNFYTKKIEMFYPRYHCVNYISLNCFKLFGI